MNYLRPQLKRPPFSGNLSLLQDASTEQIFLVPPRYPSRSGGGSDPAMNSTENGKHCVVGLVLARSGSKGVRHKNRKVLAGRPMISWVLQPMRHCKLLDEIWVSTDDKPTADIARSEGASVFDRGEKCATDDASSVSAIAEFLAEPKHSRFDVVALVQCTSPCLHPFYLDEGEFLRKSQFFFPGSLPWIQPIVPEGGSTNSENFLFQLSTSS